VSMPFASEAQRSGSKGHGRLGGGSLGADRGLDRGMRPIATFEHHR
jgi:hypothetical protein